jgi:acetyl esterase/lipase
MGDIVRDVAKAVRWVHEHAAEHGGDPGRLYLMGHSAGAQLAALLCADDRYLKAEKVPPGVVKGCVPVDGDTYDVPAIIATAEARWAAHGLPPAKYGHRQKFGDDPAKHKEFSAVTHVAKGKRIPPFLILHVADHPDTSAQARRLGDVLKAADIPVKVVAAADTTHSRINADLGRDDDRRRRRSSPSSTRRRRGDGRAACGARPKRAPRDVAMVPCGRGRLAGEAARLDRRPAGAGRGRLSADPG